MLHAQRLEDPLLEEGFEIRAGGPGDQDAQDVRAGVVHPPLARLVHQRQGPQLLDPLVGIMRRRRIEAGDLAIGDRLLDRRGRSGRPHDHAEAHAEGEQVAQGDRAVGGHGVVQRAVDVLEHLAVGQFRQQAVDRLVQPQLALLDQDHRRHGGDRLGHRGDAEDRVPLERVVLAQVLVPDHVHHRLAAAMDHGDDPGDLA